MYFFLLSYSILGAGIKYIDSAFDEKTFDKKLAKILAPFLGGLWAYSMFINPFSATILLSILLGVILKGKIDNIAHLSGVAVILPVIFLLGIELLFIPLIFLAIAAIIDEFGNDYIDEHSPLFSKNKIMIFTRYFFDHRWLLKTAILFLAIIGLIPYYFFLAMIFFDYSYLTVRYISEIKQGKHNGIRPLELKVKSVFIEKTV